jgi:hypothetical protein
VNGLAEALATGEGVERPFQCHVHEDSSASASVNVLKGVWYCFACGAKGTTDGKKKAPSVDMLMSMLEPERTPRIYPNAWMELFANNLGVWPDRFEPWSRWTYQLGADPLTGDSVFPVFTPKGQLAGVGRRNPDPESKPRYRYPYNWSASRVLGWADHPTGARITVLGEGYADAVAVAETGLSAAACYGSGLHLPQVEQLKRRHPELVVLGFDADDAGRKGQVNAYKMLYDFDCIAVDWSRFGAKDPAELPLAERVRALRQAVTAAGYPDPLDEMARGRESSLARWEKERDG